PNLKPGIYNLVAEKANQIVTVIITVEKSDLRQRLVLPAAEKNSVLDVQGSDTPPVVVGNLEGVAEGENLDGATSLTIKLTVKKEAEQTSGKEHTEIRQKAGENATILFLDAVLTKQVDNNAPVNIGGINTKVLELVIPFDLTGKDNVRVYRHHGDVDAFTELSAKPAPGAAQDETCYLDRNANLIHVYAEKFSAYAIAYDKKSGGTDDGSSTDGSDSSSDTYYYIKATAGVGGSMSTPERVRVRAGESAGFTITPDKGYQIADVKVNGKSIGAKKYYVFTNIHSDQTIHATFKKGGHENPLTGMSADEDKNIFARFEELFTK
ncbi:MAG: hypothetical protein RR728_08085, partial [Oscillospiraceae bacterium]